MDLLWNCAEQPAALLVLAHGAGAPMDSDFMNAMAEALADRGISVVRFEFPYMARRRQEQRKFPPNRAPQLLAHFRDVLAALPDDNLPIWIGGKSMGGRPFGKPEEVAGYVLPGNVRVHWLASGDHDFKPLKRSGLIQADLIEESAVAAAGLIQGG